jgi:predicted nucleotidyltransferase
MPSPAQLQLIAKQYDLRLVVLFGSQATRRMHARSDVDVAIWTERALSVEERLELWGALTRLLEAEVDLTELNRAEPLLLFQIASTGRLLYKARDLAWENFKSYAYRCYWDSAKFFADMARYVSRRAEEMRRAG